MNTGMKSTAGPRQFEQTAVAKLMAMGVPKHVADAFVKIGLPKYGRDQAIKDHVCKMEYKPFFIPTSVKDFENPLRVGAYVPYIYESKASKFHCEFQMTDIESAKFAAQYPEYDVTAKGRVTNQHAFYANKRYAEAEILMDSVFRDAKTSGLNPRHVVDLGGNDTWHKKRGREYVHCDNPVLSARDTMRYVVRQIFSGSNRQQVCSKRFEECTHHADYAIAVHSTYDMSPKQIARSMMGRGIKCFFGVVNFIPGLESKPPGQYEADGVTMDLYDDGRSPAYVLYGFRHDPSLKYKHELRVLRRYLYVGRQYEFVDAGGNTRNFVYRVDNVRGNSLLFSVREQQAGITLNTSLWSPPSRRCYFISIRHMGIRSMEVDAEMFDRLVLQAASARNSQDYDILSLYRYAKSLRQRVSINGIVLSSGYLHNPHELVYAVIAAYATAAAYRTESGSFFKEASRQIMYQRSRGFFRDVFTITSDVLLKALLILPEALAYVSGVKALDDAIKRLIATKKAVDVVLFKPHKGKGMTYNSAILTKRVTVNRVKDCIRRDVVPTLRATYYGAIDFPQKIHVEGREVVLHTKGTVPYDSEELPQPTNQTVIMDLQKFSTNKTGDWVEEARQFYYHQAIRKVRGVKFDSVVEVAQNGDRIVRHGMANAVGQLELNNSRLGFSSNRQKFAVLRGVGNRVIKLKPPKIYDNDDCIGFYLFFYGKMSSIEADKLNDFDEYDDRKQFSATVEEVDEDESVKRPDTSRTDTTAAEEWTGVSSGGLSSGETRYFSTEEAAAAFMASDEAIQGAFMSGALPDDAPMTPPPDTPNSHIVDYVSRMDTVPDVVVGEDGSIHDTPVVGQGAFNVPDIAESRVDLTVEESSNLESEVKVKERNTVSSDEVIPGKDAIAELIYVSEQSTAVALASSRAVINLAYATARGDAPSTTFKAVAQGHPGATIMVKVTDEGHILDFESGNEVEHMAVSDGVQVYDRITNPPSPGVYVTSEVMKVYTGAAIKAALESVANDPYNCAITCVDGVAGSGKSYHIENNARPGDVVLCETRASLNDLSGNLAKIQGWTGCAYTIDSYLMHIQVTKADVLWVDEAFRLHAGKLYALIKLLKPNRVYCFGDSKQIPALPFIPGYEFMHHQFPYTRVDVKRDSWRCPADVCLALSQAEYYNSIMTTHNPIMRSVKGPVHFVSGMFHNKPPEHALLVYERDLAHDLRAQGVVDVYTIGEAQGKTFDHVMLFRSNSNGKQIYYDKFQTLVALTRHRRTFLYVTVCAVNTDDSGASRFLQYIAQRSNELVLTSHFCKGVRPAADYIALESRADPASEDSEVTSDDALDVNSRSSDWADIAEEEFFFD